MDKIKHRCQHPKIPAYSHEEQTQADILNARINAGDTAAYSELSRLAVTVAEERFYRETCENCKL